MLRSLLLLVLALSAVASPIAAQESDWPRRVLLTNDDGIEDPGLLALARAFAPIAETYVVAPLQNRSGSGDYVSAIASRRLTVVPKHLDADVTAYGVDGYPADAVVVALTGLMADRPPDLVVSGVNSGPNLSDDAFLSGTLGAARIAALLGVPAIAVSGHNGEPETLAAIARWVVALARSPIVRRMGSRRFLAVSVPRVDAAEIGGIEVVRRATSPWRFRFHRAPADTSDQGETWELQIERRPAAPAQGTDLFAYRRRRIAVVPMRADEHDYAWLDSLRADRSLLPAGRAPERPH